MTFTYYYISTKYIQTIYYFVKSDDYLVIVNILLISGKGSFPFNII